ncbi:MAG: M28 family peptidase [Candidatus Thorarchaeota archaeon]|nr:M28 family peptidase [Candidatus Thorarchaeota archaeon]
MRALGYIAVVIILLSGFTTLVNAQITHTPTFDGASAYDFLLEQCSFGPRPPGSENLTLCKTYVQETLESFGWNVTLQNFTYRETLCTNIIATWNSSTNAVILLGAHYDTRPEASADPDPLNRTKPVLGANDGGSGTAVLMELARILPVSVRSTVELVFFDAEDSGGIDGWDWIQGSTYYVSTLNTSRRQSIRAMILVDMVGDSDLIIPRESSSTSSLQNAIWSIASQMGYNDTFLDTIGARITDDHSPFLIARIPAVDLIHYPFPDSWHTLADTPDKCSAESLEIVGRVLETFVVEQVAGNITFPLDTQYLFYVALIIVPLIFIVLVYRHLKK